MIGFEDLLGRINESDFQALYVASDALDPWIEEDLAH